MGATLTFFLVCAFFPSARAETASPELSNVVSNYTHLLQNFSALDDDAKLKTEVDGFLKGAKGYLAANPGNAVVKRLVDRTKVFETVLNKMRTGGCLNDKNEKVKQLANAVVKGALVTDFCGQHRDVATDLRLVNAKAQDTETASKNGVFGEDDIQRKLVFARTAVRQARIANEKARMYIDYVYDGKTPHCEVADPLCERGAKMLPLMTKPIDRAHTVEEAQKIINEADKMARAEFKTASVAYAPTLKGVSKEQAARDDFAESKAKSEEVLDVPGMRALSYLPEFDKKHGKLIYESHLAKKCNTDMSGKTLCALGNQFGTTKREFSEHDLEHLVDNARESVEESSKTVIKPLEKRIFKLGKDMQVGQARKLQSDELDDILKTLLLQRPVEFGAVMAQFPDLADKICNDIVKVAAEAHTDRIKAAVKETSLAVLGIGAATFGGLPGFAVGAVLAGRGAAVAHEEKEKAAQALVDLGTQGLLSEVVGSPANAEQEREKRAEARKELKYAKTLEALAVAGVVSVAVQVPANAERASSAIAAVRSAATKFKAASGAHTTPELLQRMEYFHKIAERAEGMGAMHDEAAGVKDGVLNIKQGMSSYLALVAATEEYQKLSAIDFEE